MKYINFSQLRSFHAVSKTGSITKASKLLSVSQPTITKQLQLIESYYKVNLINRHARGITLTDLGKKLYEITLSIFDLEEEAINLFSSNLNVHKGTLVTGTSGSYFIMKLVKEFKKLHPGIQLKIISANSNSILDKINDYDIDIAVIGKPIKKNFKPKLFIVEYNSKFFPPVEFVMKYDQFHNWQLDDYYGASLQSFKILFENFDYKLVCCNSHTGTNAFFVQNKFSQLFKEVPMNINEIYIEPNFDLACKFGHFSSSKVIENIMNQNI